MWRTEIGLRHAGKMTIAGIVLAAAFAVAPAISAAATPAAIEGVWLTESKSEMTISPCGKGWCGYITKIVVPERIKQQYGDDLEAIGDNYTDALNPDPSLRDRPIMGLQILTLKASNKAKIFDGEIYNPEDGKSYSGYIEVVSDQKLILNGCVMMGLFCKGEDWTRVK
jgi:uncharacterized protein (DUF2147 family)